MKVQRKIGASTIIEAEGQTLVELFEKLSQLEEIFRPGPCGLCKATSVGFRTREVNGIKFHEAWCHGCGSRSGTVPRRYRPACCSLKGRTPTRSGNRRSDGASGHLHLTVGEIRSWTSRPTFGRRDSPRAAHPK
jgi:hypothetical protein